MKKSVDIQIFWRKIKIKYVIFGSYLCNTWTIMELSKSSHRAWLRATFKKGLERWGKSLFQLLCLSG